MTNEQLALYKSLRNDNGLTAIVAYNWAAGGNCFTPLGYPVFRHSGPGGWPIRPTRCYAVQEIKRPDVTKLKVDLHGNPIVR
jgi:hypothetical protein